MIIMLDEGFGQKQLQQYLNDYNFILDLWLETFVNLLVVKDERIFLICVATHGW
jgi:hypothetical protein